MLIAIDATPVAVNNAAGLPLDLTELNFTTEVLSEPILLGHPATAAVRSDLIEVFGLVCGDIGAGGGKDVTLKLHRAPNAKDVSVESEVPAANQKVLGTSAVAYAQGAELIVNGDFTLSTGWEILGNWAIAAGTAEFDGPMNDEGILRRDLALSEGLYYLAKQTVNFVSGGAGQFLDLYMESSVGGVFRQPIARYPFLLASVVRRTLFKSILSTGTRKFSYKARVGNVADMDVVLDDVSVKAQSLYQFSMIAKAEDFGPAIVVGITPAVSMAAAYLSAWYRRYARE